MKGNLKKTSLKMIFVMVIFASVPILLSVDGKTWGFTAYPASIPTIDGAINEAEWAGAKENEIKIVNPWNQYDGESMIKVIAIHNDSILYIGVTTEFGNSVEFSLEIYFYTQTANEFVDGYTVESGNDVKIVSTETNSSYDGIAEGTLGNTVNNTDVGGVKNTEGKCYSTISYTTFELKMPFNSGDSLGGDIDIAIGDIIQTYFIIGEYKSAVCELIINESAAVPLAPLGILFGMVVAIMASIKRTKRRKK